MSRTNDLTRFAVTTLHILEAHEEWSADTTDAIANAALSLGLAEIDAAAMFRIKREEDGQDQQDS